MNVYLRCASLNSECSQNGALGMISGDIQDWQITASSNYPEDWDPGCAVRHSRLYLVSGSLPPLRFTPRATPLL